MIRCQSMGAETYLFTCDFDSTHTASNTVDQLPDNWRRSTTQYHDGSGDHSTTFTVCPTDAALLLTYVISIVQPGSRAATILGL